jgi:hypothetical protein
MNMNANIAVPTVNAIAASASRASASEPFADAALRRDITELVADLDQHSIGDLMNLPAKVSPGAVFPATHHTFQ